MSSYLITGSNRGIGLELVKQLLAQPTNRVSQIFAVTRKQSDTLDKLAGDRVVPIIIPALTSPSDVGKAVEKVTSRLDGKGLDVLINNAGTMHWTPNGGKTQDLPAEQLMQAMEANVVTALTVTGGFLPLLKQGKEKKIMNISSTLGSITRANTYMFAPAHAYKITKAALGMLGREFALELEPEGFSVFTVSPGWLKTDLGTQNADLEVDVGVRAVLDVLWKNGPEQNGKFLNIHIKGWEVTGRANFYDGEEVPW